MLSLSLWPPAAVVRAPISWRWLNIHLGYYVWSDWAGKKGGEEGVHQKNRAKSTTRLMRMTEKKHQHYRIEWCETIVHIACDTISDYRKYVQTGAGVGGASLKRGGGDTHSELLRWSPWSIERHPAPPPNPYPLGPNLRPWQTLQKSSPSCSEQFVESSSLLQRPAKLMVQNVSLEEVQKFVGPYVCIRLDKVICPNELKFEWSRIESWNLSLNLEKVAFI